ncbi:hypothetical protein HHI36_002118, partial [Cryptolaemus montrouzieri]
MDLIDKKKINVFKKLIELMYANNHGIENMEEFDVKKLIILFLKFWMPALFLEVIPIIGTVGYLYAATKEHLISEQLDSVTILLAICIIGSIMSIGLMRAEKFNICMVKMSDHSFGTPPKWEKTSKIIDKLSSLLYYGTKYLQVLYMILMYFERPYCAGRGIRGDESPGLLNIIYLPIFALYPAVVYGSVILIVMKIRHLRRKLKKIARTSSQGYLHKGLWICMKYHSSIVELTSQVSNFLGNALFPFYVLMPIVTALFAYQTIETRKMVYAIAWTTWMTGMVAICLIGQHLETEASHIAYDVYGLPWYEMKPELRRIVQIFLARSSKPLCLHVEYVADLNNVLLLQV